MEVNRRDEKQEPERRLRIVQMSGEPAPTHYLPPGQDPSERSHALDTRRPRRWLLLARVGWVALVVPPWRSSSPACRCTEHSCTLPVLGQHAVTSNDQAGALKGIGLFPAVDTAHMVTLTFALMMVCLVVSTVIIWRRPDDRLALIVALFLVTLAPFAAMFNVLASPSPWQRSNV